MKYINSDIFDDEIKEGKVLVDFYADWCGPCKMLSPVLEDFSKISNIEVKKVNIDNNQDIAKRFGILTIPTLILFENGKEIKKSIGYLTLDELVKIFK